MTFAQEKCCRCGHGHHQGAMCGAHIVEQIDYGDGEYGGSPFGICRCTGGHMRRCGHKPGSHGACVCLPSPEGGHSDHCPRSPDYVKVDSQDSGGSKP